MNNNTKRSSPKMEQRAQLQRLRILKAARTCFIQDGLHAGTIARISEVAQMSPGLIYRYFSSKNEIVLALISLQVRAVKVRFAGLTPKIMTTNYCAYLRQWLAGNPDVPSPSLILDICAESTRNPEIARHIFEADTDGLASLMEWMNDLATKAGDILSKEEIQMRALTLRCFIDGLLVRAVREPDLDMDLVERTMDRLTSTLMPWEPGDAT